MTLQDSAVILVAHLARLYLEKRETLSIGERSLYVDILGVLAKLMRRLQ